MNSCIWKIFNGKVDGDVHSEFVKFSRGTFENKYLIAAKRQKDKWSIKTGAEFANYLVGKCLEKAPNKVKVSGVIVSTFNIKQDMGGFVFDPEEEVKQFMGIKQIKVNGEVETDKIKEVMKKYPRAFFALSFSTNNCELKIKPKAPKSAKPAAKGEGEPKVDFCSIKTSDKSIIDDLFFDNTSFGEASIKHTLIIEDIKIPKGESDPAKMRELAVRKGRIVRNSTTDGKVTQKESAFEA